MNFVWYILPGPAIAICHFVFSEPADIASVSHEQSVYHQEVSF